MKKTIGIKLNIIIMYTYNYLSQYFQGPGITGYENPLVNLWAKENPDLAKALPTGPMLGTEDCLHLAVFTPQLPDAEHNPRLPVMVYIHGGSFMLGGYIGAGPGKLLERDMVLVAMQYRVGPLG